MAKPPKTKQVNANEARPAPAQVNRVIPVNDVQTREPLAAIPPLAAQTTRSVPEPPPPPTEFNSKSQAALSSVLTVSTTAVPATVKLIYDVQANKFPYRLNGELVWINTKGGYEASLIFGAFGLKRSQTSRGQIGPEGLMPERFSDKLRTEVAAHFNRQQGKVTFSDNTPDLPLLAGAQDRLSVLIQLAALVASAPERFAPAITLTIQTIGPRDADLWLFAVEGTETLTLPGGTLEVLKLTRNPRQTNDQQVDIWLAPKLGYLPARIRITEANGDYIDQKWLRSEPVPAP
jgi:hypothetical protein